MYLDSFDLVAFEQRSFIESIQTWSRERRIATPLSSMTLSVIEKFIVFTFRNSRIGKIEVVGLHR